MRCRYARRLTTNARTPMPLRVGFRASDRVSRLSGVGRLGPGQGIRTSPATASWRPGRGVDSPAAQCLPRPAPATRWTRTRAPGRSRDPRCASLRCDRSLSPHAVNNSRIEARSTANRPCSGAPPGTRSVNSPRSRRCPRASRGSSMPSLAAARRGDHPALTAWSTRSSRPALTHASTLDGTGPALSPNVLSLGEVDDHGLLGDRRPEPLDLLPGRGHRRLFPGLAGSARHRRGQRV